MSIPNEMTDDPAGLLTVALQTIASQQKTIQHLERLLEENQESARQLLERAGVPDSSGIPLWAAGSVLKAFSTARTALREVQQLEHALDEQQELREAAEELLPRVAALAAERNSDLLYSIEAALRLAVETGFTPERIHQVLDRAEVADRNLRDVLDKQNAGILRLGASVKKIPTRR